MKEYKMRRGETLEGRVPDMKAMVEDYLGPIIGTEEFKDGDLYVAGKPKDPVFIHIVVGTIKCSSKKDKLVANFEEASPTDFASEDLKTADETADAKNDFLLGAAGHDMRSHCGPMKHTVEDDAPNV